MLSIKAATDKKRALCRPNYPNCVSGKCWFVFSLQYCIFFWIIELKHRKQEKIVEWKMSVIDIIAIKEKFIFSKIVHFLIFCRLFKLYFILILSVNVATNNYRRLKQNDIFFGRQNVRNSTFLDDFALIKPAFVLFRCWCLWNVYNCSKKNCHFIRNFLCESFHLDK